MREGIFSLGLVLAIAEPAWGQDRTDPAPVDQTAPAQVAAEQTPVESAENTAAPDTSPVAPAASGTAKAETTPTPDPALVATPQPSEDETPAPATEPSDLTPVPKLEPSALQAEDSDEDEDGSDDIPPGHRGALLFGFNSLLSGPGSYNGIGLGVRIGLTRRVRLRGGVGFLLLENNAAGFSAQVQTMTMTTTTYSFAVDAGAEVVVVRVGSIEIYTGGLVQVSHSTTKVGSAPSLDNSTLTIAAIVGSNFFIMDALSLGAEYRIGFSYSVVPGTGGNSTVQFGVGSVGFILGYWW